jgi:DNA-binding CsgD family transcriptional regulator
MVTSSNADTLGLHEPVGLVVGVVDAAWAVQHVSVDGATFVNARRLIGQSLLGEVHPSDRPALEAAGHVIRIDRTGVGLDVHLGRPGRWSRVRFMLAPVVDSEFHLGFVITGASSGVGLDRAARLEQHLQRIARELEAAGLGVARDVEVDVDRLPAAGDLSPRQWEVLRRLLRSERVPGIAREMFLSQSTVRNHLVMIFSKVGVHSQEELLAHLRRRPVAASTAAPSLLGSV